MNALPVDSQFQTNDRNMSLLQLMDREILADPHTLYRALRERDPVFWDPYLHAWVVTGYAEVVSVLKNCLADRSISPVELDRMGLSFMKPFAEVMPKQIMFNDGEKHARLRGLCMAAFSPGRVERMNVLIESICDELIDSFIAEGTMELIGDFANPLSAIVTAKLLGVPPEDHRRLHSWVLDVAEVLGSFQHHPNRIAQITRSLKGLHDYFLVQIEEQRRNPGDGLLYALSTAEIDGQHLTDEEVIANTILILVGGHETTASLLAGGYLALLQNPKEYELLRTQPQIVASAVEELLRFESPSQSTARIAPSDMELGGKIIEKGARLVATLAAANRDPIRFKNPDQLDLMRRDNRHVAFGWASHFCFGAPLARNQCQIAFNKLLARLSFPKLQEEQLEWRSNAGFRSLISLRVGFEPGRPKVAE